MNLTQISENDYFGDGFKFLSGIKSLVETGLLANDYDGLYTTLFDEAFAVSPMGADYPKLLEEQGVYLQPSHVLVSCYAVATQCHAVTALHWFQDPAAYEIHTGIVDGCYFHSWLYAPKQNLIIEPTTCPRDPKKYYGLKVENPEVFFAKQKKSRFEELYKYACEMVDGGNCDWQSRKDALARALKHE